MPTSALGSPDSPGVGGLKWWTTCQEEPRVERLSVKGFGTFGPIPRSDRGSKIPTLPRGPFVWEAAMTAVQRGSFGSSTARASVRRRFGLLAGAVALGMGLSVPSVLVGGAAAAPFPWDTTPKPPPVPSYWYTGSEDMAIPGGGTVMLFTHPDKEGVFRLTGPEPLQTSKSVACGSTACVYNHLDWSVMSGEVVSGCGANTTTCDVKVASRGKGWVGVMNRQNNEAPLIFLLWNSDQPGGTISGHVQDEDHQGVPGASVTVSGPSGGTSAVQAGSGFYAIDVKAGDYKVVPSGVPKGAGDAQYKPRSASVSMPDGGNARADFTLDTGMKVKLKLTQSSVPADGMTVVSGTLAVTEYGKAVPDAHVLLEPQPSMSYNAAVTTGAAGRNLQFGSEDVADRLVVHAQRQVDRRSDGPGRHVRLHPDGRHRPRSMGAAGGGHECVDRRTEQHRHGLPDPGCQGARDRQLPGVLCGALRPQGRRHVERRRQGVGNDGRQRPEHRPGPRRARRLG